MFRFELSSAGRTALGKVLIDLLSKTDNKPVVFISAPASNVPNYKKNFENIKSLIGYVYNEKDYYIINPMEIYDNMDPRVNYVDKLLIGYKVIDTLVDIMVVDDTDEELLRNSKGCTCELLQAYNKNITIVYLTGILGYLSQASLENDKEEQENG